MKGFLKYYLLIFLTLSPIFAQTKENIAVLDFKAINASAAEASAISEFIGISLVKTEKYTIVERSNIDKILAEQGFQQTGCTTEECAVQIGEILNVHKAIVGTYSRIGNSYYITAKVIDVETGRIISSEKVQCLNLDYITSSIDELVSLILEEKIRPVIPKEKPPLSEPKGRLSLGIIYPGICIKYGFSNKFSAEGRFITDYGISAFGARGYINLNPEYSKTLLSIGAELDYVTFKTEVTSSSGSGTFEYLFFSIENFLSNNFSIVFDIGPAFAQLQESNYQVSHNYTDFMFNFGINFYMK
ncbi:MAG: FlgO family outer membrane protein [bacterium]